MSIDQPDPEVAGEAPEAAAPAAPPARARRKSAADDVREVTFPVAMRGYDRAAVDDYVNRVAHLVAELEATQLRETVVQRALDEVGEQTSSILQRAHETADEISSRSRAQAEGRLQRAETEAEAVRREADEYARRITDDMRELWDERGRLIEDLRRFAEEVLGVADDALDRLEEPVSDGDEPTDESPAVAPAPPLAEAPSAPEPAGEKDTPEADHTREPWAEGREAPSVEASSDAASEDEPVTLEFRAQRHDET